MNKYNRKQSENKSHVLCNRQLQVRNAQSGIRNHLKDQMAII